MQAAHDCLPKGSSQSQMNTLAVVAVVLQLLLTWLSCVGFSGATAASDLATAWLRSSFPSCACSSRTSDRSPSMLALSARCCRARPSSWPGSSAATDSLMSSRSSNLPRLDSLACKSSVMRHHADECPAAHAQLQASTVLSSVTVTSGHCADYIHIYVNGSPICFKCSGNVENSHVAVGQLGCKASVACTAGSAQQPTCTFCSSCCTVLDHAACSRCTLTRSDANSSAGATRAAPAQCCSCQVFGVFHVAGVCLKLLLLCDCHACAIQHGFTAPAQHCCRALCTALT
jgi:hypothetical protein